MVKPAERTTPQGHGIDTQKGSRDGCPVAGPARPRVDAVETLLFTDEDVIASLRATVETLEGQLANALDSLKHEHDQRQQTFTHVYLDDALRDRIAELDAALAAAEQERERQYDQAVEATQRALNAEQERDEARTNHALLADDYKELQRDVASWKAMHDTKHKQGCDLIGRVLRLEAALAAEREAHARTREAADGLSGELDDAQQALAAERLTVQHLSDDLEEAHKAQDAAERALAALKAQRCGNCFWRGSIADMATSEWSGSYGEGCRNRESACFGRVWPADHGCPSHRPKDPR